jgi:AraC family transcriptional regulator of adaptative response / DNA-3-methyladenine glycosylase II
MTYTLIGADGEPYASATPGTLGGHRRNRGYGRLDCPAALAWIAKGHYVRHRVFFADEPTAIAAAYRPCARCLPERYAMWKAGAWPDVAASAPVTVGFRAPLDAAGLLAFLGARAIPGVEEVDGPRYRRSVVLDHGPGVVEAVVTPSRVTVALPLGDPRDAGAAARLVARLLDLRADAGAIDGALGADRVLGPLVARRPGLRSPGCADGGELLVRAIVGQQVSVAGARTVLGRLAADHGAALDRPVGGVTRAFPTAAQLAAVDPASLPMPRARGRAIVAASGAVAGGDLVLEPRGDRRAARERLLALPGVGPWTAEYVAMRALGDPDVFLATDLGVRRALSCAGADAGAAGERWRPWRSYATHHLWASEAIAIRPGSA